MAYIGLKTNHGSMGTELGAALAKAFGSNVDDAVAIARLKNDLLTGEANRRATEQDILYRRALEEAARGEEERKDQERAAELGSAPVLSKILQANQGPEAPVVVEPAVAPAVVPAAAAAAPGTAPAAAVVAAEPPVAVEPVPVSAFPARPALIAPNGLEAPVPLEAPLVLPAITGRPDAPPMPMPAASPAISAFPARPAGPQLPMPYEAGAPEVPVLDTGQPAEAATGSWLDALLRPIGRSVAPSDFPARPAGPQLPMPAQGLPEAPVAVEPLDQPTPPIPERFAPGVPTSITMPAVTAPITGRPTPPSPLAGLPEEPVSLEMLPSAKAGTPAAPGSPPVEQPTAAPAAGAGGAEAAAPPPPADGASPAPVVEPAVATAAANPKPEGSVGTGKVTGDGGSVYQTEEGPIRLTKEETDALALSIALGDDPAGQLTKMSAVIKTTYDPRVTLTDNQKAILLSGHVPPGTPEEIAAKKGETKNIQTIQGADKRQYTISYDEATGKYAMIPMEGQEPADASASLYPNTETGQMMAVTDALSLKDPKTWTPQEKQAYSSFVQQLYGAKVQVAADGTVVVTEGQLPAGKMPGDAGFVVGPIGTAGGTPAAAPPLSDVPPDLVAPSGAPQPAPAEPPAAQSAAPAPAGGAKQNASGRWTFKRGGVEVPSYGGYQVEGQPLPAPTKQIVNGQTITRVPPIEGPTDMDEQVGKELGYTKNALAPAEYLLKVKPSDVPPVTDQMLKALVAGTPFNTALDSLGLTDKQRQYFQNVQAFVNAATHKSSGADVTRADLATYNYLFSLPANPTDLDLKTLKDRVRNDLKNSRTGFNGRVPSEQLRELDYELAKRGIDLDAEEPAVSDDVPELVYKDGKLVKR